MRRRTLELGPLLLVLACGGGAAVDGDASVAADDAMPNDAALPDDAAVAVDDAGTDAQPACVGLDDGIDCTVDACDGDGAIHTPDDTLCPEPAEPASCHGVGGPTQVVSRRRVCMSTTGCEVATEIVENCADPAPTARCTGTAVGGDLTHHPAVGFCDDAGEMPVCAQEAVACPPSPPSCSAGMLTSYTATCADAGGCGESSTTAACATRPARCEGPVHITYGAACADASSCDPTGTETRNPCPTRAPSCVGQVHTTWAPTCDPTTACDVAPASTTNCTDLNTQTCRDTTTLDVTTCTCNPTTGCGCTTNGRRCDTVVSRGVCITPTTLRSFTGSCRANACVMDPVDRVCPAGCCSTLFGARCC